MIVDINTDDMEINLLNKLEENEVVIEERSSNMVLVIIIILVVIVGAVFALIKLNQNKKQENYY